MNVATILGSILAGRSLAIVVDGATTFFDGGILHVASDLDLGQMIEAVALHAAMIGTNSLSDPVLRALRGHPAACRRFVALEGHRALRELGRAVPQSIICAIAGVPLPRSRGEAVQWALRGEPNVVVLPHRGTIRPGTLLRKVKGGNIVQPQENARPSLGVESSTDADERSAKAKRNAISPPDSRKVSLMQRLLRALWGSAVDRDESATAGPNSGFHVSASHGFDVGIIVPDAPAITDSTVQQSMSDSRYRWPEWDQRLGRYRPRWCTVMLCDAQQRFTDIKQPEPELMYRLSRLGLTRHRCRREPDGFELDWDAVVDSVVNARTGASDDLAVYVDSRMRRPDLGVLVLLDISSSAREVGVDGRQIHVAQAEAAASLVQASARLGHRVALYGFHSIGRTRVQLQRVKGFDESEAILGSRLGGLEPQHFTRLGAAIRQGAWLLGKDAGTSQWLLVVITDGFAYDIEYDGSHGRADAARALAEVRSRGVGVGCLSLGTELCDEVLREVFGETSHISAPTWSEAIPHIAPLYGRALTLADRRRSTSEMDSLTS